MKVNVELEYSVTDINKCYVVIDNGFYIKIEPELWEALAEYFEQETGDKGWTQLCARRRTETYKEVEQ